MSKGDCILINPGTFHQLECHQSAIIVQIIYSYQMISDIIERENGVFSCNSMVEKRDSYDEIREILQEMVYVEVFQNHKSGSYMISLLYKLLD